MEKALKCRIISLIVSTVKMAVKYLSIHLPPGRAHAHANHQFYATAVQPKENKKINGFGNKKVPSGRLKSLILSIVKLRSHRSFIKHSRLNIQTGQAASFSTVY